MIDYSIEDLADWNPYGFHVSSMGMLSEHKKNTKVRQTKLIRKRQELIYHHYNDEHLKTIINKINKINLIIEKCNDEKQNLRASIETYLQESNDKNYQKYESSNYIKKYSFDDYCKFFNLPNPKIYEN